MSARLKKNLARLTLFLVVGSAIPAVQAEVRRIISTDGATTEMLLALGLDASLVAVDVTSTLPEHLSSLPSVGYHRVLSAEGIMSLNPDVLAGSMHMGPASVVEQIRAAGVQLIRLPPSLDLDQLEANIQQLSDELNGDAAVQELKSELQAQRVQLERQALPGTRAVFLMAGESRLRLAGSGTSGDALLSLIGADNQAGFENYRTVTAEAILALQPELIVLSGESDQATADRLLKQAPMLAHTPAAQNGHVFTVDGRTLVSGIGLAALREALRITALMEDD